MAEKFDEFMEEVESDIRQEKYMDLWNRYGKFLMGGTLVGLICLVGYNLKSQYDFKERGKSSDILIGAQDYISQNRQGEALGALKSLADTSTAPYTILAKINEAGILSIGEPVQKQQAIQLYQEIINTPGTEPLWHDLAIYKKITLELEQSSASIDSLLKDLEGIDFDHSPIAPLLSELKGIILLQKGDKTQAGEIFVKLAQSKTAPEGVVMRSQLMAQIISSS